VDTRSRATPSVVTMTKGEIDDTRGRWRSQPLRHFFSADVLHKRLGSFCSHTNVTGPRAFTLRPWLRRQRRSAAVGPEQYVSSEASSKQIAFGALDEPLSLLESSRAKGHLMEDSHHSNDARQWQKGRDYMESPSFQCSEALTTMDVSSLAANGRARPRRSFLAGDRVIQQLAAFSPAMAHWEIMARTNHEHHVGLKPSTWPCYATVLLVDISGFTNLCTRLDVDDLQRHINSYFTRLIDVILKNGGDVLRFAGDAILCSWALPTSASYASRSSSAMVACATALELMEKCHSYIVPEVNETLCIHCGIGASLVHNFRVGTAERWEYVATGEALQQVAVAEGLAHKGETMCSRAVWELVRGNCTGEEQRSEGSEGCVLLQTCSVRPEDAVQELGSNLVVHKLLKLQAQMQSMLEMGKAHETALLAYVHTTARRAILDDQLSFVAEKRSVVVVFGMIGGLESSLLDGSDGLCAVQHCISTSLERIVEFGGELRQFIVDDKGVVIIWTFGLPKASYEDNCRRGLLSSFAVTETLKEQGLNMTIGITLGGAFCGRVGAEARCEYGVMGPSVNLAARLMCMCHTKGVAILCNDEVATDIKRIGDMSFQFHAFPAISVKGYDKRVTIYQPALPELDDPGLTEDSMRRPFGSARMQHTIADKTLMKMDQCGFKQQMIVKLCAALAVSRHVTINRSVIVGLYPGPSADVHEMLNSLCDLHLLKRIEISQLDVVFEFFHRAAGSFIYDLMLSDQRTRFHMQLAEWFRRRLLLRLEEDDTQPEDIVQLLDIIAEQVWRSGEALMGATYLVAGARVFGEAYLPRYLLSARESLEVRGRVSSSNLSESYRESRSSDDTIKLSRSNDVILAPSGGSESSTKLFSMMLSVPSARPQGRIKSGRGRQVTADYLPNDQLPATLLERNSSPHLGTLQSQTSQPQLLASAQTKKPKMRKRMNSWSSSTPTSNQMMQRASLSEEERAMVEKHQLEMLRRLAEIAGMLQFEMAKNSKEVLGDLAFLYRRFDLGTIVYTDNDDATSIANRKLLLRALGTYLTTSEAKRLMLGRLDVEQTLDESVDKVRSLLVEARTSSALSRVRESVADTVQFGESIEEDVLDVVLVSKLGDNQDAELALILAYTMQDVGSFRLKGVIANLEPAKRRAVFARGTLDALSLEQVMVGVGSSGPASDASVTADTFTETVARTGFNYLLREPDCDGASVLLDLYNDAGPNSLSLVVTSSMTDVAAFIRAHEALFVEKTASVTFVGGVVEESISDECDELLPAGANHDLDPEASTFVFKQCQALGVRLLVVTRSAAYAASTPAFIFDELASTGHPIALRMRDAQIQAMASLWRRSCLPLGHEDRQGLPSRCDRKWFADKFCGGTNLSSLQLDDATKIWPHITSLALYDPLAVVVACPSTLERFFEVSLKEVNNTEHLIVGTKASSGVRNAQRLRAFLMDAFLHALSTTLTKALGAPKSPDRKLLQRRPSIGTRWSMGVCNDYIKSLSISSDIPNGASPDATKPCENLRSEDDVIANPPRQSRVTFKLAGPGDVACLRGNLSEEGEPRPSSDETPRASSNEEPRASSNEEPDPLRPPPLMYVRSRDAFE